MLVVIALILMNGLCCFGSKGGMHDFGDLSVPDFIMLVDMNART